MYGPQARANNAAAAGADHAASALGAQGEQSKQTSSGANASGSRSASSGRALKLPGTMLPGQGAAPAVRAPAGGQDAQGGATPAQEGLLDYLLGGDE
jgi:hypothetical protein